MTHSPGLATHRHTQTHTDTQTHTPHKKKNKLTSKELPSDQMALLVATMRPAATTVLRGPSFVLPHHPPAGDQTYLGWGNWPPPPRRVNVFLNTPLMMTEIRGDTCTV